MGELGHFRLLFAPRLHQRRQPTQARQPLLPVQPVEHVCQCRMGWLTRWRRGEHGSDNMWDRGPRGNDHPQGLHYVGQTESCDCSSINNDLCAIAAIPQWTSPSRYC